MRVAFEKYWHNLFEFGILLKAFNGVWETVTGLAVFFVSKTTLNGWIDLLAQKELLEDPNDYLINLSTHLLQLANGSAKFFAAAYILFHGLLNLFLAIQLYRKRMWAYVFTIWAIGLAVVYQIYRIFLHHSGVLIFLTILDIIFIALTWHEYLHQKKKVALPTK